MIYSSFCAKSDSILCLLINLNKNANSDNDSLKNDNDEEEINDSKEVSKIFKANAFTIYDAMHSFLMKNKACISSPISENPMIMMKQDGGSDIRLFFSCKDQNPNEISAILELYPEPSSFELSSRIMEYMDKCFVTP